MKILSHDSVIEALRELYSSSKNLEFERNDSFVRSDRRILHSQLWFALKVATAWHSSQMSVVCLQ